MNQLTWVVLFVTFMTKLWVTTQGIYVDSGNPYDNGTLEVVNLTLSQHDAPLLTKVYYPKKIDTYAVVFFAGGLLGWIPAESYSDVLTRVASHGFVVIGVDYLPYTFPTPPPELTQHLETKIAQQLNQTGLVPDFRHLAVSCHSAGCDPIVDMTMENQTFSKAALFLEPFSFHFKTPMTYAMPAFILGTEFSTEHPACIFPREGYDHFYDMWKCPKIVMNVKGHGHCEVLDAWLYSVCAKYQFCKANLDADINKYHSFIQGISAAFLTTTLQGQDKLQYITNTTLLPVQLLEFKKDLDC